ncbi:hypothetical protein MNAN1_000639 [Malassezia nana]|uniref:NAD-dependent epimerase/dehydratase domain-containing protein n=1 Tax=Malassezia nana TaxID=180528 RepID=A0AAF0J649_9BASI|nr:hypothetical protein MNAN1_000639 [Malassezia nana]
MASRARSLLVVGGNGFVGSAVCKQALSRGWNVSSISGSGRPFRTPKGHAPAWTTSERMQWHQADAFEPDTYRALASECDAVVHTIGILMESDYKGQSGSLQGLWQGLAKGWGLATSANPLLPPNERVSYERMNRDSALIVAQTVKDAQAAQQHTHVPFVYMSAADIMRPVISARYCATKYEAEQQIARMAEDVLRPVFMRPGLMYHPHNRPWSTVPATMIDLSNHAHRLHKRWRLPFPAPADLLRSRVVPAALHPLAGALTTPALHVDTVAQAICEAIEHPEIQGAQDTQDIRQLAGWPSDATPP